MKHGVFEAPTPQNEEVLSYAPGTEERELLQGQLKNEQTKG